MMLLDAVSGFIRQNLVFTVALLIVPLKLIMLRLSRDRNAERDAMLAIPEDLSYITMGLILSGVSGDAGVLQKLLLHAYHPHMDVLLLLGINAVLTALIHSVAQTTKLQLTSWQAANAIVRERTADRPTTGNLPFVIAETEPDENLWHVQTHHFAAFLSTLCLQIVLIAPWLLWIGKLMHSS